MNKFPLKELLQVIIYPMLFLGVCWGLFFLDTNYHLNLAGYGVSPRTLGGLKGILFSPFIHGDLNHIASNSIPVLVLGAMIFGFYRSIAWPAILWMYLVSGVWLWVGGRNNAEGSMHHIGASTLIYAFASFLFFSGVFRKHKQLMVVSALVILLYGGITWAIFPFDNTISWEGHLFGLLSGILVAYNYRKEGPQAPHYQWEDEDDDDSEDPGNDTNPGEEVPPQTDPFRVTYHFVPKNDQADDV